MLVQYDLFEDPDPLFEIKETLTSHKDSLRRTQKRFFAENKKLVLMIAEQQKQIDELNNRITRLTKVG